MRLYAESMCGVDENAGVLRCHDRFDHRGKIVDIWQGFDAKKYVVECSFPTSSIFRASDDCSKVSRIFGLERTVISTMTGLESFVSEKL